MDTREISPSGHRRLAYLFPPHVSYPVNVLHLFASLFSVYIIQQDGLRHVLPSCIALLDIRTVIKTALQ